MPKGTCKCFSARRGGGFIVADGGGAASCVPIATSERAAFGILNKCQRFEYEVNHDEGRRSSTGIPSRNPARPLYHLSEANAVSRWTPRAARFVELDSSKRSTADGPLLSYGRGARSSC